MSGYSYLQQQIKVLAGGAEVDELIQRLNDAIDNANEAVQDAINDNNKATQEAIEANNKSLQTALDTVSQTLADMNKAISNVNNATSEVNVAKQGALDATAQAQTAISTMQSLIKNLGHQGTWSNTTQYYKNNMVVYNGSTFIALQDSLGKTPPTLPTQSNAYWSLLAEKGTKGDKGEKGDAGTGVTIIGSLPSEAELPATGNLGDAYLIGGFLYVWNGSSWENVGKIQGPQGEVGPQGPQGEQGPPGQDADLTEINQKVDGLQTEVTEHLAQIKNEIDEHSNKVASTTELGNIKVGKNLTIAPDGTLNASGGTVPDASTSQKGIVQLSDSLTSGSSNLAATAYVTKQLNDKLEKDGIGYGNAALYAISIGVFSQALGGRNIAIGYNSKTGTSNASMTIGYDSSCTSVNGVALGRESVANGDFSTAIGSGAKALNREEGILGVGNADAGSKIWKVPGSFSVAGTKQFEIPHPKPEKAHTHIIRHGAVESPTTGDTLYRYFVDVRGDITEVQMVGSNEKIILPTNRSEDYVSLSIPLPDYWIHLNINEQVFISPDKHFSNGYGFVDRENETLELTFKETRKYNVALFGTRNDNHESIQTWHIKGVEREVGESWLGETHVFEVYEITEVTEFEEVLQ